ncbi:MAG: RlmE family RNA methyltransferase [Thermaurantiacus sp.]
MSRARGGGAGGRATGGRARVASARGRKPSSTRWLDRHINDPYVKRATAEGYRARAAYKLIELDQRFGLLKGADRVVDLGAAPGSWTQVVLKARPAAQVVGIDLLPIDPIAGAELLQMDFLDAEAGAAIETALGGPADLVLSDMAANMVGHQQTDHLRTMALVEAAAHFAAEILRPGGAFVAKVLAGGAEPKLVAELKRQFATVRHAKPPASRKESSETYLVAQGFRG